MIAISAHESARPHWSDRHPDFTADELRQNKQLWDEIRDFRRKPEARMPEEEKAFADAANVVRDSLHDQLGQAGHPEIADLNRAYHLWSKAHEIFGSSDMQRVYGGAAGVITAHQARRADGTLHPDGGPRRRGGAESDQRSHEQCGMENRHREGARLSPTSTPVLAERRDHAGVGRLLGLRRHFRQ